MIVHLLINSRVCMVAWVVVLKDCLYTSVAACGHVQGCLKKGVDSWFECCRMGHLSSGKPAKARASHYCLALSLAIQGPAGMDCTEVETKG